MPLLYTLISISFLLSLFLVYLVKTYLQNVLVDIPNDRSSHTRPTPRGGGLGFIIAFAITSPILAYQQHTLTELGWWWLILTPLAIVGICDDRWSLPSTWRYLVQLSTATIAVFHFSPFPQPWLESGGNFGYLVAAVLTLIGMTALVNFYNFMDGLDGIVGGTAAVQIAFIAIYTQQPLLWLLVAAVGGFLYWNWAPAKIFMGDAGSTFLGAAIAIALLNSANSASNPIDSWSTLAILLPIVADAVYTIVRRLIKRENIFKAHRFHLYQRLQQSGLAHSTVASIYVMSAIALGGLLYYYAAVGAILGAVTSLALLATGELYLQQKSNSIA